ncbi:hypothetical protein BTJ39_02605 [Izhakiella australiensis]|uniref:Uncharacterized protein n=1 Tax=Izhakiella australiensis TaxID=1926881 RepID=A0A1S8YTU7_9GAMM|nr:hypothetical protein BTJ39_02605 [Izhakiella australiensis]
MINNIAENKRYRFDSLFLALSVTLMISCDTLVYKTLSFYDLKITCSGILFSFYFLISTVQTEVYGYREGVSWKVLFHSLHYRLNGDPGRAPAFGLSYQPVIKI